MTEPGTLCLDDPTTGNHSWESRGLDVARGVLVHVRVCVWCQKAQERTYLGNPNKWRSHTRRPLRDRHDPDPPPPAGPDAVTHIWIIWEGDDPSSLRIAKVYDSELSAECHRRQSRAEVCVIHRYEVADWVTE